MKIRFLMIEEAMENEKIRFDEKKWSRDCDLVSKIMKAWEKEKKARKKIDPDVKVDSSQEEFSVVWWLVRYTNFIKRKKKKRNHEIK